MTYTPFVKFQGPNIELTISRSIGRHEQVGDQVLLRSYVGVDREVKLTTDKTSLVEYFRRTRYGSLLFGAKHSTAVNNLHLVIAYPFIRLLEDSTL